MQRLLDARADPRATDTHGDTPLHYCGWNHGSEAAAIARRLVAANADVDAVGSNNVTPLHLAADEGHTAFGTALLELNARVNPRHFHGRTPLDFAENEENEEFAQMLRDRGGQRGDEVAAHSEEKERGD